MELGSAIVEEDFSPDPSGPDGQKAQKFPCPEPLAIHRCGTPGAPDDHRAERDIDLVHQVLPEEFEIGGPTPLQEELANSPSAQLSHEAPQFNPFPFPGKHL